MGIAIQAVTPELAQSFGLSGTKGVLVNGVEPDSAAAKAGILAGDVILSVNSQEIINPNQLPRIVSLLGPNKSVTLEIFRSGKTLTLMVNKIGNQYYTK